jgi:CheY-like chemotaxis protein
MSQGQTSSAATVLLLEADPAIRRMITLGLQHRGLQVIEAASLSALPSSDLPSFDLLILDVDHGVACNWTMLDAVQENPDFATLPTVILSWEPPVGDALTNTPQSSVCVTKPFDARALYKGIDHLLTIRTSEKAGQLAQAEAALLASYNRHGSASIWPVVTAAGLLLMVIGLLLQFVVAIVGLLIVITALLLWTIGSRTQVESNNMSLLQSPISSSIEKAAVTAR